MSINTVQQAFEEFERTSVRVPNTDNQAAKRVQQEFRDHLEAALGQAYADSFLAGSYARKTQSVRLKDLDIIVVLNDPDGFLRASASATLSNIIKPAAQSFRLTAVAKTKCRAVECELFGFQFWADIVPGLDDGSGRLLLAYVDRAEGIDEWRHADPKGQVLACQAKNALTGGIYVPVTRICKYWNQSFTSSPEQQKPMPSYLAEAILYDALSGPCDWADAALAFFENAYRHLSNPAPSVLCPGSSTDYVDEKLDDQRRLDALAKVTVALDDARAAVAESDPGKAMDDWAKVFGPAFPAPSTNPLALSRALRAGTFSIVGSGVSVSPSAGRRPVQVRAHAEFRAHS